MTKIVLVETVSTFRHVYAVRVDDQDPADFALDDVAHLRLVDRTALLLLHNIVPGADVRLALDEDGDTRLYLVV